MNLNLIPSAKEATMFGYSFSCTVHDALFGSRVSVITIDAETLAEAHAICALQVDVIEVGTCLGSIDREPQVFLAW